MVDIFYPLEAFSKFIVSFFIQDIDTHMGEALIFFMSDTLKILILLFLMIFVVGILRTYIPQHKIKKLLTGKKLGMGNFLASIFGAITPFCSCSSIPIFLGFLDAGIPLGVTFSFLITSPLVNEYVAVLMWGYFGWKIAVIYVISGLLIGVFSGLIIGKLGLEKYLVKDLMSKDSIKEKIYSNFKERIRFGYEETIGVVKKIWIWVVVGVGISAIIHGFIPQEMLQNIIAKTGLLSVPIAALLGVPLYANCSAVVPIALVLFQKGIPLGTALAFMMGTAALSFPEAIILRRAMKFQLIAIFFGVVTLGIIIIGYLFNILEGIL